MATTYTTNYNLGKQENHADKFDMDVITDNADKIDAALTAKADKSTTYTKTEVDTALSGKQATLTTAQLAAVNSGITSAGVEQIETNKNNILSLLPTTYSLPTLIDDTTCTINDGGYITVGNIIVVNVTFTTSASYTAYGSIMQFPAPKNTGSITMVAAAHIDSSVNVAVNKFGQLALFDTPLPAGTYHFFTVYLKQ